MTPAAARDSHPVPWHGPMGWDDRLRMHSGRAEDIRKGQLALPPGVTLLERLQLTVMWVSSALALSVSASTAGWCGETHHSVNQPDPTHKEAVTSMSRKQCLALSINQREVT